MLSDRRPRRLCAAGGLPRLRRFRAHSHQGADAATWRDARAVRADATHRQAHHGAADLRRSAKSAMRFDGIVMPALVAGIHVLNPTQNKDVGGRNKSGHDERVVLSKNIMPSRSPAPP